MVTKNHPPEPVDPQFLDSEVLIVEDTPESLVLLSELMQSVGYSVRQAQDGEMALLSVQNRIPDLILLDVRMPNMDGFEVCKRLKSDPITSNIPIIFLSALQESEDRLLGLRLGAVDYISKPYEPQEVLLRVRTHLELRNLQLHLEEMVEMRTQQLTTEINDRRNAEYELLESRQKLRELTGYLEDVREDERARIAREIHDELGQALTVIRIDITRMATKLDEPRERLQEYLDNITSVLEQATDTARTISENLRPGMLDLLGLEAAIGHHVERFSDTTGIPCALKIDNLGHLNIDSKLSTAVFRIVQESLTNIARHAQASKVDVSIADLDVELVVIIQDNGTGIPPRQGIKKRSYGLLGMSERTQSLGGNLMIESVPGKGTRIEASFPYQLAGEKYDSGTGR